MDAFLAPLNMFLIADEPTEIRVGDDEASSTNAIANAVHRADNWEIVIVPTPHHSVMYEGDLPDAR